VKGLAGIAILVAMSLGLAVWAGDERASAARPLEPAISSRLLLHGRVRCTATVKPAVEVGQAVTVGLTVRNISKRPAAISFGVFSAGLVLHAADGTTYDSAALYANFAGIPPPIVSKLRPGATRGLGPIDVTVRWNGPLRITPRCLGKALPSLHVTVTAPGPPPADGTAAADVVAASGHLLDRCTPQAPGVAVYGQIYLPTGDDPPMDARCSVSITPEGAFSVAQVLVVTPPGLAGVQIYQPYETLWPNGHTLPLASDPPYEAIAWEFVVTREGATPVAASTQHAACGEEGFAWGGTSPDIEFISACPA
jgi:hypothetical protein